ncbi:MAG: hypothetical protein LIP10_12515, partial [Clostridiales bacterium]|nr:hypothetical protein [Clostridiales bacterium]
LYQPPFSEFPIFVLYRKLPFKKMNYTAAMETFSALFGTFCVHVYKVIVPSMETLPEPISVTFPIDKFNLAQKEKTRNPFLRVLHHFRLFYKI